MGTMRCVSHAQTKAIKQCTSCQRAFCGLCVKQLTIGARVLEVCSACKQPLGPVTTRIRPSPALGDLLSRPLSLEGLLTAAAISLLAAALGWMPGIGNFVHFACGAALVAYYFQIIAHIGEGKPGLPGPSDAIEDLGEMRRQTLRGWVCVFAAALPFIVWNNILHDGDGIASPPIALLLVALGLPYLPAAIVCVVLTSSSWGALYPVAWFQVITRAPASYAKLLGLFLLSLAVVGLILVVGRATLGHIPIAGYFVVDTVVNLALFAQAALVGGFLMRHAEDFGYD
jgi:hypothetical protein